MIQNPQGKKRKITRHGSLLNNIGRQKRCMNSIIMYLVQKELHLSFDISIMLTTLSCSTDSMNSHLKLRNSQKGLLGVLLLT